ncbi:DUF4331 family protein [Rhizobium sp. ARZ01]|uniref:DUF4331 family protein n=1 Tax=Rhizobium sp. ARZ01 TaxID=2769313 RepID=UPI00178124FF|nr:DUF4331 family protein [Rhizobium sp. ARZ01]MBD9372007.1 DUF4331 family protein [Rhizobium sp. ARZ01]
MSDHADGPRTAADPSIDVSDFFAFINTTDPRRTVLIANVFPFAGETALFSNAVNHSIVVRRMRVAGIGNATSFVPADTEIRFTFQFEVLQPRPDGERPRQTGACFLPDGRTLTIVVDDEAGASTPNGEVRVFAGLRSEHFYIGWIPFPELISAPNFVQENNVLSMVVELDTERILEPDKGSLFGAIAETTPRGPPPQSVPNWTPPPTFGLAPPRFDWVGRPELTNFCLIGVPDAPDLRDLWNQEEPFAIREDLLPVYRERLRRSFQLWDMRDGNVDWDPAALAANVNVFLNDFLLFDVAKPITDTSHLEIERSTIDDRTYTTGGGRTLDANAVDILVTWLVNHDHGPFLQGGAMGATQPGGTSFPFVKPPNKSLLEITRSVDLAASPQDVWAVIGQFGGPWHPLFATIRTTGTGIGQLRRVEMIDGKTIVDRLAHIDESQRSLTYTLVSGFPAAQHEATLEVRPKGAGSTVTWRVKYRPEEGSGLLVSTIVSTLLSVGLDSLKTRFGSVQ